MLLYLMRHGIAEDLSLETLDDAARALTSEGHDRTHRAALGLAKLVKGQPLIFSSPKSRARQTAQIVRDALNGAPVAIWDELENGPHWREIEPKLRELGSDAILVGHEPHLSQLTSEILTGKVASFALDFKKAGVCVLEINLATGEAVLEAFLTPKSLRKMAPK